MAVCCLVLVFVLHFNRLYHTVPYPLYKRFGEVCQSLKASKTTQISMTPPTTNFDFEMKIVSKIFRAVAPYLKPTLIIGVVLGACMLTTFVYDYATHPQNCKVYEGVVDRVEFLTAEDGTKTTAIWVKQPYTLSPMTLSFVQLPGHLNLEVGRLCNFLYIDKIPTDYKTANFYYNGVRIA